MNLYRLFGCVALCQIVGVIAGAFTAQSVQTWYVGLTKPFFSPPNWLFGPVWITLYLMMGVALYLVWQKSGGTEGSRLLFVAFFVQLFLNGLWSFIFFGLRSPFWGFVEISVLWASVVVTIALFWRASVPAALLLVPYALWVSFAAVLNYALWRLNLNGQ